MLKKSLIAVALMAAAGSAQAGTVDWTACDTTTAALVTTTSGCYFTDDLDNDPASDPVEPNIPNALLDGGWSLIQQGENADAKSGNWSVPTSDLSEFLLIFKGAKGLGLYGYVTTDTSGSWNSPFFGDGKQKDTSHISYYGREGDTPPPPEVPLPGTLGLLGLGLAGLGAVRRRKS